MNRFNCKNCNLEFDAEDAKQCPRCSSSTLNRKTEAPKELTAEPRRFVFGAILNDTKDSWMKYHNNDAAQVCAGCGGKEFEFIWKRKEKVCKKCGDIMPLRRR